MVPERAEGSQADSASIHSYRTSALSALDDSSASSTRGLHDRPRPCLRCAPLDKDIWPVMSASTSCGHDVAQTFAALCRYCCKSLKLPGGNFPAVKKSDRRPLIRVPSIALPRSSASLSSDDEVPHIFTRKSRLKPGEFLITSGKRLLQQNRHFSDIASRSGMSAAGES